MKTTVNSLAKHVQKKIVLDSNIMKITVKFAFTNSAHVPASIKISNRPPDKVVDKAHADVAKATGLSDLGNKGRHRQGRVDTGIPVIQNLQNVAVHSLIPQLLTMGFNPGDVYAYVKEDRRPGKHTKWYACLELQRIGNDSQKVPAKEDQDEAVKGILKLMNSAWGYLHVWHNPDGTVTINLLHKDAKDVHHELIADEEGLAAYRL